MYIKVRVRTDSKRERVTKVGEHSYEIAVREPAQRNLANRRVRELIAHEYEIPTGNVRLVSGHRAVGKVLSVEVN